MVTDLKSLGPRALLRKYVELEMVLQKADDEVVLALGSCFAARGEAMSNCLEYKREILRRLEASEQPEADIQGAE